MKLIWIMGLTAMSLMVEAQEVKVPRIGSAYINVYQPAGDIFPGPGTSELDAGTFYNQWVPNDHGFVKDESGRWHAFGITHPITSFENIHQGETQSFHALAPEGCLKGILKEGAWKDLPKVLPPSERPGEMDANHAPYIVKHDGLYHMIYGPAPIRYAVSDDLMKWTPKGELGDTPVGRDPSILFHDGIYYLTVCGDRKVWLATSANFKDWKQHGAILTMPEGVDPESPSIVRNKDTFYLFVCGWNGQWDRVALQGAYQHKTYVYQSDDLYQFTNQITIVDAHAPEIFQDEAGDWYISSVEWPHRGVSIARLDWE